LIYDATPHNLPAVAARTCRDLTVLCGSASKAYAMTGWRCGWAIGPATVIAALTGSQAPATAMLDQYRKRRDHLHDWLTADPRVRCRKPAGAFYLFIDVSGALSDHMPTTTAFAQTLLEEEKVALTQGEAFDAPGFVRISYATSMEALREGSARLLRFVARHAPTRTAGVV